MKIVTLSALQFDLLGFVRIVALPDSETGAMARRVTRVATLDGGAVLNDAGFADGDRTITLRWRSSPSVNPVVERLLRLHGQVTLAMQDGAYRAALERFENGPSVSTLTVLILEKLTEDI